MTAVYPWLAAEGVLTFLHWSVAKLGVSHLLDIEYVTWAHPGSEVLRCPKPVEALLPWDSDMSPPTIKVRPDTEVIVRERERIGPAHGILFEDMAEALKVFPAFTGSLGAAGSGSERGQRKVLVGCESASQDGCPRRGDLS